jgi:hypothetical protein
MFQLNLLLMNFKLLDNKYINNYNKLQWILVRKLTYVLEVTTLHLRCLKQNFKNHFILVGLMI